MLACFTGYIVQAIVNQFSPLLFLIFREQWQIPLDQLTLLVTINFLVQLLVDAFCAKYVDRIGYRKSVMAAHLFVVAGLLGLVFFPKIFGQPYWGIMLAVVLYAVGGGLIEVLISPIIEACPTQNKASIMSLLHSFYCWGSVLVIVFSTVFFYCFGKMAWRILTLLWALIPLANTFLFAFVPLHQLVEENQKAPLSLLFSSRLFWLFIFWMISAGAAEQAMSQWASAFAEMGLGISKTLGDLLGPCMFSILMGLARLYYAKYGDKIDLSYFIGISGVLGIVSYLLAALARWPLLSLVGCALAGLSCGILWPGIFSLASASFKRSGTALFAFLALAGDMGCSLGPTVVGMVSSFFDDSLKAGLAVAVIFPVMIVVLNHRYQKISH